jgi:predicted flap endonuclease-1-like 5' DNA nuclease
MNTKRGITVWIFAFISFLTIMASIGMVILLINVEPGTPVNPYLLSIVAGTQPVETYLFMSLVATSISLAVTCLIIFRKQPPDPEIVQLLLTIVANLATLKQSQENSQKDISQKLEYNRRLNQTQFNKLSSDLETDKTETMNLLAKQERILRKSQSDLVSTIETKMNENREKMLFEIKKQEGTILGVKRLAEGYAIELDKQRTAFENFKISLERIEDNLVTNQDHLKSLDDPEEIKGIGPALGKELRLLGISNVGEFLTTDPSLIGEKTRVSKEMAENLQAMGQFMMIPGVDSSDAELLVDTGIKSMKELAEHDLILLSRKIDELAKIYVEQGKLSKDQRPTIEEIASWKRTAR